jgi:hypothetical protein
MLFMQVFNYGFFDLPASPGGVANQNDKGANKSLLV